MWGVCCGVHIWKFLFCIYMSHFFRHLKKFDKNKNKKKNSSQTVCFLNGAPDCGWAEKLPETELENIWLSQSFTLLEIYAIKKKLLQFLLLSVHSYFIIFFGCIPSVSCWMWPDIQCIKRVMIFGWGKLGNCKGEWVDTNAYLWVAVK